MNNLLFDEPPIVVSPTLAKMLGDLEEAAILQQIHYWTQKNMNIRDGYSWVYNSMKDWWKQLPWFKTEKTLRSKFTSLEKKGLLVTGNYNKAKFDRTKWYRIDYDAFSQMVTAYGKNDLTMCPNLPNASGKNYPTNTIDYTENTTENSCSSKQQAEVVANAYAMYQMSGATLNGLTTVQFDEYVNKLGNDLVCHAIEIMSVQASHPNFNFLKKILDSYENVGITTVEQAIELEDQFKAKKQQRQANNAKPKQTMERDLSNKHYGTDEELEAEFFGEAH